MPIRPWRMLGIVATAAHVAAAQTGARITGSVRDSAATAVPNADIIVIPADRRVRADSEGHFEIAGLKAGKYTVRARRFGFIPGEWSVDLSHGGHTDVQLVLGARLASLDPVVVSASRECSPRKFDGFMCRRGSANGVFLDYTDIDDQNVYYTGDLFNGIDGFHSSVRMTPSGVVRVPAGGRCINTIVNGEPATAGAVPEDPYNLMAVEIYRRPADVPKEFRRHTWGKEQCSMIVYWTVDFSMPLPRARLPH